MFGHLAKFLASGVSASTANTFAYLMLVVVGIFLVTSAAIAYIYIRKNRRENPAPASNPA
jgi:preprotein translocase subunit SecG